MTKGYPNDSPLQTKLATKSSSFIVIFDRTIVAAARQDHVQRMLTMNSMARDTATN
jgi:hypothetical protein